MYTNKKKLQNFLEHLVNISTYTEDKQGIDSAQEYIKNYIENSSPFAKNHFKLTSIQKSNTRGNLYIYSNYGHHSKTHPKILLSGHIDTVFPKLYSKFKVAGEMWFGPGINDMKGGLAVCILSLEEFMDTAQKFPEIWLVVTPDEEEGSMTHKDFLSEKIYPQNFDLALIFEGGGLNQEICVSRKGVLWTKLITKGKASHSGYTRDSKDNAIVNMSSLISAIQNLKLPKNSSINIGTIQGGVKPNIVPSECSITLDIRYSKNEDLNQIKQALSRQTNLTPQTIFEIPPLKQHKQQEYYLSLLYKVAAEHSIILSRETRGGGSDGNQISMHQIPVIDGLGAVGQGAHTGQEYILETPTLKRIALLKSFLKLLNEAPYLSPSTANSPSR